MLNRKSLILFLSCFIPNTEKRKQFRQKLLKHKFFQIDTSKMKIGVSYSVFDGEELLEASIKSIRSCVHYINVVWQEESWQGNKCSPNLKDFLFSLKDKGLIDEVILYPYKGIASSPPAEERKKRNMGLEAAKKAGCNYFMNMDTDEFYNPDEFEKAKKLIIEKGATHTACSIYTYWKDPHFRSLNVEYLCVPFIYKIDKYSKLEKVPDFPCRADATRHMAFKNVLGGGKPKFFFINDVSMHHMSYIRADMMKKFNNASVAYKDTVNGIMQQYNDINKDNLSKYGLVYVDNIFDIDISKFEDFKDKK